MSKISDKLDRRITLMDEKDATIKDKDSEIESLRKEGEAKDTVIRDQNILIQHLQSQLSLQAAAPA